LDVEAREEISGKRMEDGNGVVKEACREREEVSVGISRRAQIPLDLVWVEHCELAYRSQGNTVRDI